MIVVSGEALMDVFDGGATATGQMLDARIGGSPFNVALGLARQAQPVQFFGGIGRGFLGERLMQALRAEGIGTDAVVRTPAPTTISLVGLDAQGVADYAFYGQGGADLQPALADLAAVPSADAYHFGSYAMVMRPVGDTQRALVAREHQRGQALLAYDVNVRTNVQPDLAVWRDTVAWMARRVHVLKMSDEDLHHLAPGADAEALAAGWLREGVALVVLTRGAAGARAWCREGAFDVAPVPVQVVDTVGAGDTLQATLLAGLAERGSLSAAGIRALGRAALQALLSRAAVAAAITCGRRGADLPRRSELPD